MEESATYQAIIARGMRKATCTTLLKLGRIKFGPPSEQIEAALQAITDLERLDRLTERLLFVSSWQELLDTP